ncbi:hypothetical protein C8F01DRAFT_1160374 [Mycena amicta]|nr:hypothetical protein C8F01DRAFT_1160374 [Mycena amicta]
MSTRSRRRTQHARRILLAALLIPIFMYFFSSGPHSVLPPALSRTFDTLLEWLGTHCLRVLAGTALLTTMLLLYGLVRTVFMYPVGESDTVTNAEKTSAPSLKDETRTLLAAEEGTATPAPPTDVFIQAIQLTIPGFLFLLTLCTSYLLLDLWLFDVLNRDRFDESLAQNLLAVATHELHGVLDVGALATTFTVWICCWSARGRKRVPTGGVDLDLDLNPGEDEQMQGKVGDNPSSPADNLPVVADGLPAPPPAAVSPKSIF